LYRYLVKPSSLSPQPSPLIDERKKMQSQPREEPTGADNSDIEATTSHFMKDSRSEDVGIDTPSNGSLPGNNNVCLHSIILRVGEGVQVMVFNATFNNISVISWRKPPTCRKSLTNFIT
jgi:hypothetical protein